MNAHAVDCGEPGILGVIDKVKAVRPTDIAGTGEQFRRHSAGHDSGCTSKQVPFLHDERSLAIEPCG